jgi:hypothetical protein
MAIFAPQAYACTPLESAYMASVLQVPALGASVFTAFNCPTCWCAIVADIHETISLGAKTTLDRTVVSCPMVLEQPHIFFPLRLEPCDPRLINV